MPWLGIGGYGKVVAPSVRNRDPLHCARKLASVGMTVGGGARIVSDPICVARHGTILQRQRWVVRVGGVVSGEMTPVRPLIFSDGWLVVVAAFAVTFVGFGSAGPASAPSWVVLQDQFGASRGSVSLVFSLAGFVDFGLGIVSGPLADRWGSRRLAITGMLSTRVAWQSRASRGARPGSVRGGRPRRRAGDRLRHVPRAGGGAALVRQTSRSSTGGCRQRIG